MKIRNIIAIPTIVTAFGLNIITAHCQVPCGIYDDAVRIIQIREHVTTIEKAMNQIDQLTNDEYKSYKEEIDNQFLLNPTGKDVHYSTLENDRHEKELEEDFYNSLSEDDSYDDY